MEIDTAPGPVVSLTGRLWAWRNADRGHRAEEFVGWNVFAGDPMASISVLQERVRELEHAKGELRPRLRHAEAALVAASWRLVDAEELAVAAETYGVAAPRAVATGAGHAEYAAAQQALAKALEKWRNPRCAS